METKTEVTQTPGQKVEDFVDTVKQEQATDKTFTQAQVDEMIKERLSRKEKQYADYKDLKAAAEKLKAFEAEKLTEQEKAAKKLADLENAITEKENLLKARDLKDKKRSALEKANLGLTEGWTLSDIIDLMPGDEDEIPEQLKIWQKRFPAAKSLGTGTQTGTQNLKDPTLAEQVATINIALQDPKVSSRDKRNFAQQLIALNRRLMQGEK